MLWQLEARRESQEKATSRAHHTQVLTAKGTSGELQRPTGDECGGEGGGEGGRTGGGKGSREGGGGGGGKGGSQLWVARHGTSLGMPTGVV